MVNDFKIWFSNKNLLLKNGKVLNKLTVKKLGFNSPFAGWLRDEIWFW